MPRGRRARRLPARSGGREPHVPADDAGLGDHGLAVIGFGLGALVLAAYYGMTLGVVTTLLAIVLAAIPLTIVIPTFLWLDRYEAEPTKYLVAAFLWGHSSPPCSPG